MEVIERGGVGRGGGAIASPESTVRGGLLIDSGVLILSGKRVIGTEGSHNEVLRVSLPELLR